MKKMRTLRRAFSGLVLAGILSVTSGCISFGFVGGVVGDVGSWWGNALVDLGVYLGCSAGNYFADVAYYSIQNGKAPGPKDFSPEQQYYIGRGCSASIVDHYKMANVDDPKVRKQLKYLNQMAGFVSVCNPDGTGLWAGLHIGILASDEVAAFSTPGGYIWVTHGALMMVQSEDELAALLCHELGHMTLGHAMAAYQKDGGGKIKPNPWLKALDNQVPATRWSGNYFGGLAEQVQKNKYGKDQEYAADKWGIVAMEQAGYSHEAMFHLLNRVDAWEKKHPNKDKYLLNHPAVSDRINELKDFVDDNKDLFKFKPKAAATKRQNARFTLIMR